MIFFLVHLLVLRFVRLIPGRSPIAALEVENAVLRHQVSSVAVIPHLSCVHRVTAALPHFEPAGDSVGTKPHSTSCCFQA